MRILLVVAIAAGCWTSQPTKPQPVIANAVPVAKPSCSGPLCLPELDYVDIEGKRHTRASLVGHVVVVNFWATWTRPSRKEFPLLARIHEIDKEKGVIVLGILVDNIADHQLGEFVSSYGISYPVVRASDEILTAYSYPDALPVTFVFDRSGKQASHHVGMFDQAELEALVDSLVR